MTARPTKHRKPIVVFCELRRRPDEIVNISSQNGAEGVVSRMLPKSHVSHVILNANVSEERFLDMKVSTENKMKKKSMDVHDHFINTFIKRLERKQKRWEKEDNYVSKNFQVSSTARPRIMSLDFAEGYPEATPAQTPAHNSALYRPAKYPYSSIGTRQRQHATASPVKTAGEFPPISNSMTPSGQARLASKPIDRFPIKDQRDHHVLPQRSVTSFDTHDNFMRPRDGVNSTLQKSGRRRRRVAFKEEDNRFVGLMDFLSPVYDKSRKTNVNRLRSIGSSASSTRLLTANS